MTKTIEEQTRDGTLPVFPTISGDPLTIYTAARKIADISFTIYEVMGRSHDFGKPDREDRRNESANPYYSQTTGGLFLEQYYSGPGSIWTPWGKWGCWGGWSGTDEAMDAFLAAIGQTEVFAPVRHTSQGTIGPVYAILKVGDIELPKPELRERVSYLEYEDADRQWDELTAQYKNGQ